MTATASTVRIFINYRRSDTRHVAGRLRDQTVNRFGENSVFVDVESIRPGQDYVSAVDEAVSRCDYLLVLIGEEWLTPDDAGVRRIDDPNDLLRLEIEAGLRHATVVIPVLVDNASMPTSQELPPSLVPLARHQAVHLRHDSFSGDARDLLDALDPHEPATQPSPPSPPSAATPQTSPTVRSSPATRAASTSRWLSVLALAVALVWLLVELPNAGDVVATSRGISASAGGIVWLLPALPVVLALLLMIGRGNRGAALGCVVGALFWALTTASFVARNSGGLSPHMLLAGLLLLAAVAVVVSAPSLREPASTNSVPSALGALALLLVAIAARATSRLVAALVLGEAGPGNLITPSFLLGVLIPVLLVGPAVLLRMSREQTSVLLAAGWLQVLYPLAVRTTLVPGAIRGDNVGFLAIDSLIFLTGSLCIVLAVRVGQRSVLRSPRSPTASPVG